MPGVTVGDAASYPRDRARSLVAARAAVEVEGPDGARGMLLEDLRVRPAEERTAGEDARLEPGGIITGFSARPTPAPRRSIDVVACVRGSQVLADASVARGPEMEADGETVRDSRPGPGGAATVPRRADEADDAFKRESCRSRAAEQVGHVTGGYARAAFGVQFVGVAVHALTGAGRVPRMPGAYGHVPSGRTARQRLTGGLIRGVGSILRAAAEMGRRHARVANSELGERPDRVSADAPSVEALLVAKLDVHGWQLGAERVARLGSAGVDAMPYAIGRRRREVPTRIERLSGAPGPPAASRRGPRSGEPGAAERVDARSDREAGMRKVDEVERADWKDRAEAAGFAFHTMHGEPYWDETSAYAFTLEEIETRLEDPSTALHAMVREAVDRIAADEEAMARLGIPEAHMDLVAGSWRAGEAELYGRLDLAYDGSGPARLLEYNADTPTSLYEAGHFQWDWLEGARDAGLIPAGADQLNRLQEALTERFAAICAPGEDLHFAAVAGVAEDYANVETLAFAARDAGLGAHYVDIGAIGVDPSGRLVDDEARVIGTLFKLYPWEDFLRDDAADALAGSGTRFLEPPWKALASNKGILAVLWEMFEGHPNLLPTFLATDAEPGTPALERAVAAGGFARGTVRKPLFSREGAGVRIDGPEGTLVEASAAPAQEGGAGVVQAYAPLPELGGFRPVMGTWIVGETCVALGIREDKSRITQDLSRFKPHYIEP